MSEGNVKGRRKSHAANNPINVTNTKENNTDVNKNTGK